VGFGLSGFRTFWIFRFLDFLQLFYGEMKMKIKLDAFCMDSEFVELLKKELNVTVLNPDNSSPYDYEFEGSKENLTTMVEVHWNMEVEDSDFYE
jgi:hypothetical protein